jgi:WD40 repeat protein
LSSSSAKRPRINSARFAPYGGKFGACDAAGRMRIWDLGGGDGNMRLSPIETIVAHSREARDFAFLTSYSFLATVGNGDAGWTLSLWDVLLPSHQSLVSSTPVDEQGCASLAFAPGALSIVCGGRKGWVSVFDVRQRAFVHRFQAHGSSSVHAIAVSPDERTFVTGAVDGDVRVWDLASGREVHSWHGLHDKKTYIWPTGGGAISTYGVRKVHATRDHIFSCGADGKVLRMKAPTL